MVRVMEHKDLWNLYCRTIHSFRAANSQAWINADLTMPQLRILFTLAHKGELTVSSIAKQLGVKIPNVTFILDNLVEQDLVSRERSEDDRRLVMVSLTNKGRRLIDGFNQAKFKSFQKALVNMDARDKKALLQGLQALEKSCKIGEKGEINEQ